MGLQSTMTTALTGLQAAETTIDVVGNNVANSSTVGFKQSHVLFATQFLQTQSIGSAPSADRGGTNPRQTGLGVKVAAINPDFSQGTIQISANPLDVAIQGDGFLIVQGSQGQTFYTRNGQIQTNSDNELVTVTGNRVLGYTVDDNFNIVAAGSPVPLRIPLGARPVTQPTENAFFNGVLTSQADVGDTPAIIESEVLGDSTFEFPTVDSSGVPGDQFDVGEFQAITAPNTSPSSGSAAAAATTLAAGDYRYRISWYVNSGGSTYESSPSGIISVPGVGATDEVDLINLPEDTSPSSIWDGRNIYRSIDGGAFQLLSSVPVTGTTFTDDGTGVPGAALDDSTLNQGNYSYYVTFFDSAGGTLESRPSARIGAIATGTDGRIRIDDLPQPTTASFDSVRIYRNTGSSATEFHLVDTLPAGVTTYIDGAPDADILANPEIDLIGVKAGTGSFLTDVVVRDGDTYTTPFEAGVLSFAGRKGEQTIGSHDLTITATTTVQDLIDFMEQSFGIIDPTDDPFAVAPGGSISNGVIDFTSNMGTANALSVGLSAFSLTPTGSTSPTPVPIAFSETQPANGDGTTTDFVVYDSLGTPLNVRITTVLEEKTDTKTVYRWFATSDDNEPTTGVDTALGTGKIEFDGNGNIQAGSTATIDILRNLSASESPLEFQLDFSQVSGLGSAAETRMDMISQDGFPPGTLTSFIITESGLIRGVFTNGAERPLGQIRMARFANNVGLQQVGENLFTVGVNSGNPLIDNPGENGNGSLTAGALELSNTDIGQNLIDLILASTQYRGGARVITTAQQLLDELLNLRR